MIKVVLDTSVFVSALLSRTPETAPNQILKRWQQGAFSLVIFPFPSASCYQPLPHSLSYTRANRDKLSDDCYGLKFYEYSYRCDKTI